MFSLKKTVMKIRPQINGPIDVGYGNYILTAPAAQQRNGRTDQAAEEDPSFTLREKNISSRAHGNLK